MPIAGIFAGLRPVAQALGGIGSIVGAARYAHSRFNQQSSGSNRYLEDSSYAQAVRTNLPTLEQPSTTETSTPTYAEVCPSMAKTGSPVGTVKPRTTANPNLAGNIAFDSYFHWDRLCWR